MQRSNHSAVQWISTVQITLIGGCISRVSKKVLICSRANEEPKYAPTILIAITHTLGCVHRRCQQVSSGRPRCTQQRTLFHLLRSLIQQAYKPFIFLRQPVKMMSLTRPTVTVVVLCESNTTTRRPETGCPATR